MHASEVDSSPADSTEPPPPVQTEAVGFTAYEDTLGIDYSPGETIDFPHTTTNVGGHYSTATSEFTCPYNGFYMFSVSIMCDDEDDLVAQIMLDGTLLASAYADDLPLSVHETHHQASQVVVTECVAGARVWIESGSSGEIYSDSTRPASFSGVLLNQYNATRAVV